jgi:alpha-L-fucosidase
MLNPIYEDRLLELGNWMKVNGEAIHGTSPWKFQNDTVASDVW